MIARLLLLFITTYVVGFITLVIRRKLRSPEKSWLNCTVNIALSPLRYFRIGPFKQGRISLQSSIKYAMRKSKLTDFGGNDSDFVNIYDSVCICRYRRLIVYIDF